MVVMGILEKIIHIFIPRSSNNHKAKLLHSSSLLVIASLLVVWQGILTFLPSIGPNILGYAAQISPDEIIRFTNEKRTSAGLSALTLNTTLSSAAYTKGRDMIERDYWAHVAPDGTQPWKFFSDAGYRYRYAGENLARDFTNPTSTVNAWMDSPTHRENILNSKYKEIGIGVIEGDLAGVDTTIVVQFFGTGYSDVVTQPLAVNNIETVEKVESITTIVPSNLSPSSPEPSPSIVPIVVSSSPIPTIKAVFTQPQPTQRVLISPFTTTKSISLGVVGILLAVFLVDSLIVSKRKIARIGGRTFAHMAFLGMILSIVIILKSGQIL